MKDALRTAGFYVGSFLFAGLALTMGCTDVQDYSTAAGECYQGRIIEAEFVRSGFESGVVVWLSLDTEAFSQGDIAGRITSNDGRFSATPVRQMPQVAHDSLSMLHFPGGRLRNYLAHCVTKDGVGVFLVISLMENEDVELRVMRPAWPEPGTGEVPEGLFGVFRLVRASSCGIDFEQR